MSDFLWPHFLSLAKERCSPTEFENWISPIRLVEETAHGIVLEVPNVFVQEYLIANYKKELQAFSNVRFVIAEEKKARVEPISETAPTQTCQLNPLYTFDHFIEGASNQFVKSAALGVAAKPGKSYNPLFIHGGVGLGKTHLLHAIGHMAVSNNKKIKIGCITTEAFINEIIEHLKTKSMDRLKKHYRSLDLLLVDDIQFLENRLNFEEEICNTFETLLNQSKQIVITCDKPPTQLKLSQRLIGRMEWGLVAHIGIPDLETRVAILQHKAELKGLRIPHKIAFFIAEHIYHNVRQLEGALNRLLAYSRMQEAEMTQEVVESSLGELLQSAPQRRISVETILKSVATLFGVRESDLRGSSRVKNVAFPRQVAMYLAKEMINDSLSKLSSAFGGKTHSTLIHAWKKVGEQVEKDETLRRQIQMARRNLEN